MPCKAIGISTTCGRLRALLLDHQAAGNRTGRIIFAQDVIDSADENGALPGGRSPGAPGTACCRIMGHNNAYAQACVGPPQHPRIRNTGLRRDVTLQDLQDFTRLTDALDHINIASPIFPRTCPQEIDRHHWRPRRLLRDTSKPIRLCLESRDEWPYIS